MRNEVVIGILACGVVLSFGYSYGFNDSERKWSNKEPQVIIQKETSNIPSTYVGEFKVTHYCSCPICTGTPKGSRTATGNVPYEGRTIAVDPKKIPLNSIVYIEGLGTFVAEDTGGAIKEDRIDIYVNDHQKAKNLGTRGNKKFKVFILK